MSDEEKIWKDGYGRGWWQGALFAFLTTVAGGVLIGAYVPL